MRHGILLCVAFLLMISGNAAEMIFWGPGSINGARSLAIAPNGDLWLGVNKVAIFGADGKLKEIRTVPDSEINAIVFTSNGTPVLGTNHGTITWLYPDAHKTISGVASNYAPWGLAIDKEDYLYATDAGGKVVRQYNPEGFARTIYEAPGDDAFERPFDVAVDSKGRILVSDERKNGLWVFNRDGTFVTRLFTDTRFWRLKMGADGLLYAVSNAAVAIDLTQEKIVYRYPNTPGGLHAASAFAVDAAHNVYVGNMYDGIIRKINPEGKTLQTIGPSYKATLQLPDGGLQAGRQFDIPMTIERIADLPAGTMPPSISLALQPAVIAGEPDSAYSNSSIAKAVFREEFLQARAAQFKALERVLPVTQTADALQVTVPADLPSAVYKLFVSIDPGIAPGRESQQRPMRVVQPGATASLTLYVPRQRSVFQHGETMELNAILRSSTPLAAGTLNLSLAPRRGDELQPITPVVSWLETPLPAGSSRTLTFHAQAGSLAVGRYLLVAEAVCGGQTLRDSWPLTIVPVQQATRFRILFPEWSAGYTHIWGPFTGKGMRSDLKVLADEGITLYDVSILAKDQAPPYNPTDVNQAEIAALLKEAAADPALPAAEHYLPASPLEIEFQEALRHGLQLQREIWGSHFLSDWGHANPWSIPRDNRDAQLWTQWQREWPNWLGHRYLTLSLTSMTSPETKALLETLKAQGIAPASDDELRWARNAGQRRLISDAPAPADRGFNAITADAEGNVYIGSLSGAFVVYNSQGEEIREAKIPGVMDLVVAKDGTVYGANDGYIAVIPREGAPRTFRVDCSNYSPRSIVITQEGNLLVNDKGGNRILRYSPDGTLLGVIGSSDYLKGPSGLALFPDGALAVGDDGSGSVVIFDAEGKHERTIPQASGHTPGGKNDLAIDKEGVIWSTNYSWLTRMRRDGSRLPNVGRGTFAPGSTILPQSLAFTPAGNLLLASVSLPYLQELTPALDPVRQYGLRTLYADLRTDRTRVTWQEKVVLTLFFPVDGQQGVPGTTVLAFGRNAPAAGEAETAWMPLAVDALGHGVYSIAVPRITGNAQLKIAYDHANAGAQSPLSAIFPLEILERADPGDATRIADITQRELRWHQAWARSRMGTLVRWTQLSDVVAGRPTMNTAPMNWGVPDLFSFGVYPSFRRDAVVAETHNSGHDHGDLVFSGAWYAASSFAGPDPKPAWSSLLEWYWGGDGNGHVRPRRDLVLYLGAGVSGIGTGRFLQQMDEPQLALHRDLVAQMRQIGDASLNLELPGRGGVAVLRSMTQEAMDPFNEEHFWTAHAAWYDLLRMHVPAGVVDEDSIAADMLISRGYKAVLLPMIQFPLGKAVMDGLARFQQRGGEVWVDLSTRITVPGSRLLPTRYRPVEIQDLGYSVHSGFGTGAFDGNWEYWSFQQESNARLPAVQSAFGRLATMPVQSSERDIVLQRRDGGQASYIFASSDHYPDVPLHKVWLAREAPAPFRAELSFAGGAVYDVFAQQPVTEKTMMVDFTNEAPARIYAVLPRAIAGVALRASVINNTLFATAEVKDAAGATIAGVVPIELLFTDPAGNEAARRWTATGIDGICRADIPLGWMAAQGNWTVTARELLSGQQAPAATVAVGQQATAAITAQHAPALTFDLDAIKEWLQAMRGQEVAIPLDKDQQALREEAERLAAGLVRRGIKASVVNLAEIPEVPVSFYYTMTEQQQQAWQRVRNGEAVGLREIAPQDSERVWRNPGPRRLICRPLILLGTPGENRLLADIDSFKLARRQFTPGYPGPGRALVQYLWAPFYDGYDVITINAADTQGIAAGVNMLLQ